jgi:predicted aspartyl protease
MRLDHLAAALGGQRVDGVIGTVLLYHFLATLDYVNDRLLLRRRTDEGRRQVQRAAAASGGVVLPFWLAGDHFMFARGSVNGREPVLLFVDTGLAGGGFVCSEAAAQAYGIDLTNAPVREGVGGAGPTRSRWFTVDSLSMGGITQRNIRGVIGNLQFRASFGFAAGGIVSHQFFRPYAVTFDFDGMHLLITP